MHVDRIRSIVLSVKGVKLVSWHLCTVVQFTVELLSLFCLVLLPYPPWTRRQGERQGASL